MRAMVLGVLLAVAMSPAAVAQLGIANPDSAAVTLHLHLMDPFNDFPINTQPMDFGAWNGEPGVGLATHTFTCTDNPPAGAQPFQEWHTYRGYSSPSYVEYNFTMGGRPRVFPERQMGYDLTLDAGVPPILHWYLETQTGLAESPILPVVIPNVIVQATLRATESPVSVDDKAYDTGPLIARGRSPSALLAADATQGAEHSMVDGRHVYGFTIPMQIEQASVGTLGYALRIDVFLDNPACADPDAGQTAMTNFVLPFADPEHRPRITAGALNPLRILALEPRFNGTLVEVTGIAQSVWGNYDVDEGNLTLAIDGPGGAFRLEPSAITQRYHEHNHHADPVEVTWVWDRNAAPGGLYWLNWTVGNDQQSADAAATAAVRIGPDEEVFAAAGDGVSPPREMPNLSFLAAAAVALAAALRRSRSATVKNRDSP